MNYEADFGLGDLISRFKKRLTNNTFYGIFVFSVGLTLFYISGRKTLNTDILMMAPIFLVIMFYLERSRVVPYGLIVNNTAIEITIEADRIITRTYPFKVLFWINKPSKEIIFNRSELEKRIVPYPVTPIYDLGRTVLRLREKKKEVYVIIDYFDQGLREEVEKIKDNRRD